MLLNGTAQTVPAPELAKESFDEHSETKATSIVEEPADVKEPVVENEVNLISAEDFFASKTEAVQNPPKVEVAAPVVTSIESDSKNIEVPEVKEMQLISFEDLQMGFSQPVEELHLSNPFKSNRCH